MVILHLCSFFVLSMYFGSGHCAKCMTPCDKYGYSYNWCYTGWKIYKNCTPSEDNVTYHYKTSQKITSTKNCLGDCRMDYENLWCFVNLSEWDYCSRRAEYSFKESKCMCGTCTNVETGTKGYSCIVRHGRHKIEREACAPYTDVFNSVQYNCHRDTDTDSITPRIKRWNPHIYFDAVWDLYDNNFIIRVGLHLLNDNNPITYRSTFEAPPIPGSPDIELVGSMRATIYHTHLRSQRPDCNSRRPPLSPTVENRMKTMQILPNDERGHILADCLGGPNEDYNFVPQTPLLNRGVQAGAGNLLPQYWRNVENQFLKYLQEHTLGRLEWSVIILYKNLHINRRPTGFLLNVTAYDDNGNYDDDGSVNSLFFNNESDEPLICEFQIGTSFL